LGSVATDIATDGGSAKAVVMNVTSEADWKKALDFAKKEFGGLNILVNNAGWTYTIKDTLKVTEQEFDCMSTHMIGDGWVLILRWQVSSTSTSRLSSTR
jgi:NAD(P)-dependent dehydrogenase (short-subunit alcohol dehydrogenase family)